MHAILLHPRGPPDAAVAPALPYGLWGVRSSSPGAPTTAHTSPNSTEPSTTAVLKSSPSSPSEAVRSWPPGQICEKPTGFRNQLVIFDTVPR